MENVNQDAIMHAQPNTYKSDSEGSMQIPDEASMLEDSDNGDPTGTLTTPAATNTGASSGSPAMEPDTDSQSGTGESIGNNDGTEISPEASDEVFLK